MYMPVLFTVSMMYVGALTGKLKVVIVRTFCARLYGSGRDKMLSSGDLLFMCGVTKQKYQTRSRQNQYLYVAVSCELLTRM